MGELEQALTAIMERIGRKTIDFRDLFFGDRFDIDGTIWTKVGHNSARRHSEEEMALGARGFGYIGSAVCGFELAQKVRFVPIESSALNDALIRIVLKAVEQRDERIIECRPNSRDCHIDKANAELLALLPTDAQGKEKV